MSAHDFPAYEEELEALAAKLKGHERPDAAPSADPPPHSPHATLHSKLTPIGGGRFHVAVERGALAHSDALRLASERQPSRSCRRGTTRTGGGRTSFRPRFTRLVDVPPIALGIRHQEGVRPF